MRTWRLAALFVAASAAACGDSSKPAPAPSPGPYTATIDVSALVRQLGAEETFDADEAAERLAQMGDAVIPPLDAALAKEGKTIRLGVVETLGQMESPRAFESLARVARSDPEPEVRATAVMRLGESGKAEARRVLEAALDDPSPMVGETAAVACGALCTSRTAIDRMLGIALETIPEADLPRVRASLGRLLGGPDHEAARYAHDRIVARTSAILTGAAPLEVRARAAMIAMQADVPGTEPILVEAVRRSSDTTLRTAALQTLARSGTAAAVPPLAEAMQDPSIAVAAAGALQAIAARGVPEATAALAERRPPEPSKTPTP